MSEKQFDQKVVFITGAGSGIGRAAASAFAREGATVAVADINEAGGGETVAQIEAAGGKAKFFKVDTTSAASVENLVRQIVGAWGKLDIAINNAGIGGAQHPICEIDEDTFDRIIAVNLKGVWLCMKYAIPQMLKQGGGVVINVGSALGITVIPGASPYNASKFGVAGLTKTCAVEYGGKNIRVNAICPGMIRTPAVNDHADYPDLEKVFLPLHPIGRLGTVEEVADCMLWLASDKASFVHGAMISVDGGWTAS
jgi:NAD(P)-dependent dehydrogenase (short-subunit alcohol dehydrogenase family)